MNFANKMLTKNVNNILPVAQQVASATDLFYDEHAQSMN